MTFKPGRTFYLILIICTFLWNQQTSFLTQKIAIENSYRDKVISALSRLLGQENFIVIVNVEFATVDGSLKKKTVPSSEQSSSTGYTPIPGLPTIPDRDGSLSGVISGNKGMTEKKYSIGRVEIDINLNEKLAAEPIKQEIQSLVEKVIPETSGCEGCIKIESLGFLVSEKSQEIQELKKEIAALKSEQMRAEEDILKKELKDAEDRLKEARSDREESEERRKSWEDELERRDALEHTRLIEFEKSRNKQDSMRYAHTENELRQVRNNKMHSDSTLLYKTMNIVEKQFGSNMNEEGESLLGMQIGSDGSSIMSSVIFILLIICLMIVTFLAANNKKPKPIYLKAKTKKTKKKSPENNSETNEEKVDNTSSATMPNTLKRDEDAIRSELRSLQQTAVSLSVGEKENASALIKEWLEDNPNKGESMVEE